METILNNTAIKTIKEVVGEIERDVDTTMYPKVQDRIAILRSIAMTPEPIEDTLPEYPLVKLARGGNHAALTKVVLMGTPLVPNHVGMDIIHSVMDK